MSTCDLQAAAVRAPAGKLLSYRSMDNPSTIQKLWNTRDGLIPAQIFLADGSLARYAQLIDDPILPRHRPEIGDTVIVDMTVPAARQAASAMAPQFWKDGTAYGRSAQLLFRSELEVVSYVFDNLLMDMANGVPFLEVVTVEVAAARGWS